MATRTLPQPNETARKLAVAAGLLVLGLAATAASVYVHPVAGFAAIAGLIVGTAMLVNTTVGIMAVVGVAYLLPFAVVPIPIGGVRLTFLDVTLTVLLLVWVFRMLLNPRYRLITSPLDPFILAFVGLAIVSFVIGIASVSGEVFRFFLKTINSILFFWTVLNVVRTRAQLEVIARVTLCVAGGAGAIATVLYILPDDTARSLLNGLRVLNYPTGDVLRYIATTTIERAIGTAIDPNVLGGMLMLSVPLIFTQLLSSKPLLERRWLIAIGIAVASALILTYSRGSWLGAVGALIGLGTLRYRKLWLLFPPIVAVILLLPQGEIVTERLIQGAQGADLATQMRLGEYRDALRTIEAYPWFGVGFGGAPEIDLYTAAASIYLVIAQQMGLIGLAAFLVLVTAFFLYVARNRAGAEDPVLQSLQYGFTAAIGAALIAGVLDHYFFNLDFPHTIALFWLYLGLAVTATRLSMNRADGTASDG